MTRKTHFKPEDEKNGKLRRGEFGRGAFWEGEAPAEPSGAEWLGSEDDQKA
jgi:hypothetical protein